MNRYVIFSCGILALAGMQLVSAGSGAGAPQSRFKNLKVLTDLTDDDLQKEMQGFTKALGVTCSYCHDHEICFEDENRRRKLRARCSRWSEP